MRGPIALPTIPVPIQMAVAYAAIANGGEVIEPRIVLRRETRDGDVMEVLASMSTVDYAGRTAVLTFFRDISDEVETRRELTASRERLSLALLDPGFIEFSGDYIAIVSLGL